MTSSRPEPVDGDDEALSWGDELDASHVDGPARTGEPGPDDRPDDPAAVKPMSSAALIGHGILGGALLLCAVGWVTLMGRFTYTFDTPFATGLWRFGVVVAVAAPVLWFAATIAVVPAAASRRRLVALLIGVLIVAPWPLLVGVGA